MIKYFFVYKSISINDDPNSDSPGQEVETTGITEDFIAKKH